MTTGKFRAAGKGNPRDAFPGFSNSETPFVRSPWTNGRVQSGHDANADADAGDAANMLQFGHPLAPACYLKVLRCMNHDLG